MEPEGKNIKWPKQIHFFGATSAQTMLVNYIGNEMNSTFMEGRYRVALDNSGSLSSNGVH